MVEPPWRTGLVAGATPAAATFAGTNNGLLAFVRGVNVFTAKSDGTAVKQLTHVAIGQAAANPRWSKDGKHIAYEVSGFVFTMNADGTAQKKLYAGTQPVWAPSGTALAFLRTNTRTLCTNVFTAPATAGAAATGHPGSNPFDCTGGHGVGIDYLGGYSNDGKRLLLSQSDGGGDAAETFVVEYTIATNARHTIIRFNVVHGCGTNCFDPDFDPATPFAVYGPTNKAISFACNFPVAPFNPLHDSSGVVRACTGETNDGKPRLASVGIDGTNPRIVDKDAGVKVSAPSPKGGTLAVYDMKPGTAAPVIRITTVANGTNTHTILTPGYQPDWQPIP